MLALLLQVVIVLLIAGICLWAIGQFPIDATIYNLIRVAVVVVVAIYLIYLLAGVAGVGLGPVYVPRRP